jgi:hypothetical protein
MSSEAGMYRPSNGMPVFFSGAFYLLYGPTTSINTTTTETSIFGGDTSITTPIIVTAGNNPYPTNPGSSRAIPANALNTQGTMFNGDFYGTIKTNGTPNIQFRLGLVNSAGTFTALADTTAQAMTSEASSVYLHVSTGFSVLKTGSTGSIQGYIGIEYAPTNICLFSAYTTTTSLDLTQNYTLDIRATWGTSDANNIVQINHGAFEIIG